MGIGVAAGENRATDAAKKAISSPLLETSIDGAKGVLMNITGGSNLSLYEVNEAADIVSSASDEDVNMIFGSVINEDLKDEILVTVIATGFDEVQGGQPKAQPRPKQNVNNQNQQPAQKSREEQPQRQQESQRSTNSSPQSDINDTLDIPAFLRNRNRRR